MVEGGKLITIEKSAKHAEIALRNFELTGVADRVEIKVGDAHQVLLKLVGPFDFVFIDADKAGYLAYLEWAAGALRSGGVLAAHNAFRGGQVLGGEDEGTAAIRAFLRQLAGDPRWLGTVFQPGTGWRWR